jgi:sigma-B regulation protein RsbU (phosphoserine phosphatase)
MAEISEPYLRDQLEKRRAELTAAISSAPVATPPAPFLELLSEVDSALERMDHGTYGICPECNEPVEKERLIADPLVRVCLDHLPSAERRALEGDLELAARVQRGLLPEQTVHYGDWHIRYEYKPAGVVGGDYCDLILPPNGSGKLVFLLGDAAGKGVAASMLMAHLHAMFRSLAGLEMELAKLLETANRVFCESTFAGQYATIVCGRAGRSGEVEIASAGHFPVLLVTREGVKEIESTGLPLGMFCTSPYTIQRARLEPGDSMLLFTDGISETVNPTGNEYGVKRLARLASERHGWVPQELLAACLRDVAGFSSGTRQADDQTLMVIHRNESGGALLTD